MRRRVRGYIVNHSVGYGQTQALIPTSLGIHRPLGCTSTVSVDRFGIMIFLIQVENNRIKFIGLPRLRLANLKSWIK